MITKTLYNLNEWDGADVLHHPFLKKPNFVVADVKYTNVLRLGTVGNPWWRCYGEYGKWRVGFCFGVTEEEAKRNALKALIEKWYNSSSCYPRSEYAEVMWM